MARKGPRKDRQVLLILIPARITAVPGLWGCQVDTAAPEQEDDNAPVDGPRDPRLEVIRDSQGLEESFEAVSASVLHQHLPSSVCSLVFTFSTCS